MERILIGFFLGLALLSEAFRYDGAAASFNSKKDMT